MITIAVDGPAGAGKGTLCRLLARHFNLIHIESGLFYRSLGRFVRSNGVDIQNEAQIIEGIQDYPFDDLHDPELRSEEIASIASQISVHPKVRNFVNERMHLLQKYVRHPFQGLIVDGRDIGTVVFPDADAKIFLTAEANVRAGRRNKELNTNPEECLKEAVDSRDVRDTTRTAAPLAPAEDAIVIDTTHLSEKQVFEQIQTLMHDKFQLQEASYEID